MRLLCPVLLVLSACSDYNLSGKSGGNGDGEGDSDWGTDTDGSDDGYPEDKDPTVCEPRDIEGYAVSQTDECLVESLPVGSFTPVLEWKKDTFAVAGGLAAAMTGSGTANASPAIAGLGVTVA